MHAKRLGATLAGALRGHGHSKIKSTILEDSPSRLPKRGLPLTRAPFLSRLCILVLYLVAFVPSHTCGQSLAGDSDGWVGEAPVGPGSGTVGSFAPGLVQPTGSSDMGNGEVVENLTGDLLVTHPVAVTVPLGPELNISVARVYKSRSLESKPWDIDDKVIGTSKDRHLYPYSWVGYRWDMHMGKITTHGSGPQTYYIYEGPGGDEHRLYRGNDAYSSTDLKDYYFTNDGSNIRAKHPFTTPSNPPNPVWEVYFPDDSYWYMRNNIAGNPDTETWYAQTFNSPHQAPLYVEYHDLGEGKCPNLALKRIYNNSTREINFKLAAHTIGPDTIYLLDKVTWKDISGDHAEQYNYSSVSYDYPYYSDKKLVPVLTSVISDQDTAFETTVAYDYAHKDEMSQNDPVFCPESICNPDTGHPDDWYLHKGLRLSDIYYSSGLRSHYEYAQDMYLYSQDEPANNLPHPPPATLNPDTENWVYHSGVGVTQRWAVFTKPDPSSPYNMVGMAALQGTKDPAADISVLKWTWNRDRIRRLPDQPTGETWSPFVVTTDPTGREVAHYYQLWVDSTTNTCDACNTCPLTGRCYPSISPTETATKIFTRPVNFKDPASMDAYLAKKIKYTWVSPRLDGTCSCDLDPATAVDEDAGDLKFFGIVCEKDGIHCAPISNACSHVQKVKVTHLKDQISPDILIENSGWDGYGHYEHTKVTGEGIAGGAYETFQSYNVCPDGLILSDPYLHMRLKAKGAIKGGKVSASGYIYNGAPGCEAASKISSTDEIRNASGVTAPVFYLAGDTSDLTMLGRLKNFPGDWTTMVQGDVKHRMTQGARAGNIIQESWETQPTGLSAMTRAVDYSYVDGYGPPTRLQDIVGVIKLWSRDIMTGLPEWEEDENAKRTTFSYDSLRRLTKSAPPAGEGYATRIHYPGESGGSLTLAVSGESVEFPYIAMSKVSYMGPDSLGDTADLLSVAAVREATGTETFMDALGRPWLTKNVMPDGSLSCVMTVYGRDGQVAYTSQPYEEGSLTTGTGLSVGYAFRDPSSISAPADLADTVIIPTNVPGTYTTTNGSATTNNPFPSAISETGWAIDPLGRVCYVFPPAGSPITYVYAGLFTKSVQIGGIETDTGQQSSRTVYYTNALGQLIGVDTPGADAAYEYDVNGKLTAACLVGDLLKASAGLLPIEPPEPDPEEFFGLYNPDGVKPWAGGQVRTFTYDNIGRLTKVNDPVATPTPTGDLEQGYEEYLAYGPRGSVLEYRDKRAIDEGYTLKYTYDWRDRLISLIQDFADASATDQPLIENKYKDSPGEYYAFPASFYPEGINASAGKLVQSIRHNYESSKPGSAKVSIYQLYRYAGPMGRLSDEMLITNWSGDIPYPPAWADRYEQNYRYNNMGLPISHRLPDFREIGTAYSHGVPVGRSDGTVAAGGIGYNAAGQLTAMTSKLYGRALASTSISYDPANRLESISYLDATGAGVWGSGTFQYDGAGNIKQAGADTFRYDLLGRLAKATVNRHLKAPMISSPVDLPRYFTYEYDLYGNLTGRTERTSAVLDAPSPSYDDLLKFLNANVPGDYPRAITADQYMRQTTFTLAMNGMTNRASSALQGPPATPEAERPENTSYNYDPSGNVLDDRAGHYDYDALGRQVAASSPGGSKLVQRMYYAAGGERVVVVTPEDSTVTTTLHSGGKPLWEQRKTVGGSNVLGQKAHLYASGRLVATVGDAARVVGSPCLRCLPPTVNDLEYFTGGRETCVPELSEPIWTLTKGGSHADLLYEVLGLCDDIAWVEVRKSRIKDGGKAPCGGSSCEDEVEIKRLARPQEGWGPAFISFDDLQGDKSYQVLFAFASDAAGHPAIGPMSFAAGGEVLGTPKGPGSISPRMKVALAEADGSKLAWRFSADAPGGYNVIGKRQAGDIPLAASLSGEDVEVMADDPKLDGLSSIGVESADGTQGGELPAVNAVGPTPPPPPGTRTVYETSFYASDHLGTVREVHRGVATFYPNSTTVQEVHLERTSTHDYEPFGVELFPTDSTDNTIKFTGQEEDECTGNLNLNFRMYQDAIGRFLKPDNIAGNAWNPQSFNRYSYVEGNPVNRIDPDGRNWFFINTKWEWHPGKTYTVGKGDDAKTYTSSFTHLMAVDPIKKEGGVTTFSVTLWDQNKVVAEGYAYSGGAENRSATYSGNYLIRADKKVDPPTETNPNSKQHNPPSMDGIQKINLGYLYDPKTGQPWDVRAAYGPMRARLNPILPDRDDMGFYYHGQDRFTGVTHGCLCYGKDTTIIEALWDLDRPVPVAVNVPVVTP